MLFVLRWLSRRSLRFLHGLGAVLGWAVYALSPSYRRRHRANAALAGIDTPQRRQAVAEAGKMVLESLRLWLRPAHVPIADPVHWQGAQIIEECLAGGRGLLFLTPHLGSFEITAQAYAQRFGAQQPITVMYRPARYRMLRELEEAARARPALATAPASIGGVRQMMRALKRGEAVGLLPDQVPPEGLGVWSPVFGKPAYTMTLAARLALQTGATVLLVRCEREPMGRGFVMYAEPLPQPLDADLETAVRQVNEAMEHVIRQCPGQYLWGYGRYKTPREQAA